MRVLQHPKNRASSLLTPGITAGSDPQKPEENLKFHRVVREVMVKFRGGYAYVDALGSDKQQREHMPWLNDQQYADYLSDPHQLCRLGWLGDDDRWLFHFWKYSDEKYEPSFLPSGACDGTREEAFDCAGTVYFLT